MPRPRSASAREEAGSPFATTLFLTVLLVAGVVIRFQGLGEPLVSFHPLRHYRSAIIARTCFYESTPSTPGWAVAIARAGRDIQQAGEPPVSEWLACAAYRIAGRELLVIPRALSVIWWISGAIAVYLIGRRLLSRNGALVAATLHLSLPYAIIATRTFQPDSLMTACAIWATFALLQWHERPTRGRLITAASLTGLALLVKPMSVFVVMPAMVALAPTGSRLLSFARWRGAFRDVDFWWMAGLALVPPGLYYGTSLLAGSLARDQLQTRFVPSLLASSFFWEGLARQAHRVFGWTMVGAAAVGTVAAVEPLLRRLLCAIWLGYAAFAVAFTYHVPTHDYYHLPFIPVAALAAAAGIDRLCSRLRWRPRVAFAATCVLCAVITWRGATVAWPTLRIPNAAAIVADYERIGEATQHDGRIIFLDLEYGYSLMYHAQVAGDAWPGLADLDAERLDGRASRPAARRFAEDYAGMHPRYFVVTDFESLEAEPELRQLLTTTAVLVDETSRHRVYRFAPR